VSIVYKCVVELLLFPVFLFSFNFFCFICVHKLLLVKFFSMLCIVWSCHWAVCINFWLF